MKKMIDLIAGPGTGKDSKLLEFVRKNYLVDNGLMEENWIPSNEEVRIYSNSLQRTIATANYFAGGMFPIGNIDVEYHMELGTMDPVFNPVFTFLNDKYIEDIEKQGYEILDMTCPDVKKVQQKAIELAKDDYLTVIVGKEDHPEVIAIKENAKQYSENVFVISNNEEIENIKDKIKEHKKVGIVVQTTQMIATLNEVLQGITPLAKEIRVFNTICASTSMRQKEAKELATQSDLMVVVGSKKSANTTHLAEIVQNITKTIHIEDAKGLEPFIEDIKKAESIGDFLRLFLLMLLDKGLSHYAYSL